MGVVALAAGIVGFVLGMLAERWSAWTTPASEALAAPPPKPPQCPHNLASCARYDPAHLSILEFAEDVADRVATKLWAAMGAPVPQQGVLQVRDKHGRFVKAAR